MDKCYFADGGTGSGNFPMIEGLLEALSENPSEIEILHSELGIQIRQILLKKFKAGKI